MDMLIAVLIALVLYVLPGLAVLQIFRFSSKLGLWDRLALSIVLSIIIVTYTFVAVGNIFHFIPTPVHVLVFSAILFVIAFVLQRANRRPDLQFIKFPEHFSVPRLEKLLVWLFIIGYAILANLPRIIMFVEGGNLIESAPLDEPWHIAELVSVARSGIPPLHYYFPDLKLTYYYAAWVYPAIIGNTPFIQISLSRAMSIHVFMLIFSFLAACYYLIYSNIKSRLVRIAGILMFTVMGGFDLFVKLPGIEFIDWWQLVSRWITSNLQISQFTTIYIWVPHHLAAAISFVLLLFMWRNLNSPIIIKAFISGILLGFCFITSPFVFLFSSLAIAIIVLLNVKLLFRDWKQTILVLLVVVFILGVGGWNSAILYTQQGNGGFGFRDFYVNVIQDLRGGGGISSALDKAITVLGFPLVAGWIGVIELGLAFILYVIWVMKEFVLAPTPNRQPIHVALAIFPLISLFLIFFIEDRGGGDNFGMRGFIPAQICIVLAGLLYLDDLGIKNKFKHWQKWLGVYIFGCFLVAQSLSSIAEIRAHAVRPIKVVLTVDFPVPISLGENIYPNWPIEYDYIHWLNQNSPLNSLVLDDCPPVENTQYRFLERLRFIDPRCVPMGTLLFQNDFVFVIPTEWSKLLQQSEKAGSLLNLYSMSPWSEKNIPTYFVDHGNTSVDRTKLGVIVFQDAFVTVYRMK